MSKARDIKLGAELRKRREAKDVSLRAFAEKIGIKPTYLSRVENGLIPASEKIVVKAAKVLGDDPDELFLHAERVTERMCKIAGKYPKAFADLFHHLENQPENAIFRVIREVRDGKW